MNNSRRSFMRNLAVAGLSVPFAAQANPIPFTAEDPPEVHLFSKHLQFLDYSKAAEITAEMGFNGLDLTVRPNGHILPENVKNDLPVAIQKLKATGLSCRMITTVVSDVQNPLDVDVIETAARNGVDYYRSNWFKFRKNQSMEQSLAYYSAKVLELSQLNKKNDIVGCYQNHSGRSVGASFWEIKKILDQADTNFFGVQYDIRHAVAEGGQSWPNGLELLKKDIKTIVIKDFKWGKANGKWQPINVPIGEGMVDFKSYFSLLKKYALKPPVSLHLEYPLGGAEKGDRSISVIQDVVFKAMRKDLINIQNIWKSA